MMKFHSLTASALALLSSDALVQAQSQTTDSPPTDFQAGAGALELNSLMAGLGRSSNNLKTMLWMVCQRNDKCKNSMDKDQFLELLKDHGCNCFPSKAAKPAATDADKIWYHHKNNGIHVDELDFECQKVAQAYTCMDLDSSAGDLVQVGKHGCYHGMVFDYHFDNKELICGPRHNVDYLNKEQYREQDCKQAACEIERNFAIRALEIMDWDPVAWQAANADKKGSCPKKSQGGKKPVKDSCCGHYPERAPYNSLLKECCDDGSSANVGACG